jgi:hypothetical protein
MVHKSLLVSSSLALFVMALSTIVATPENLVALAHVKMAEARSMTNFAQPQNCKVSIQCHRSFGSPPFSRGWLRFSQS